MTFKPQKHSFEVKNPVFILCDKFENAFFDKLLLDDYYFINEKDEKLFSYEAYKTEGNCFVPKVLKDEERTLVFSCKYDKNGDLCSYILHEPYTQNDTLHSYLYEIEYKETKESFISVHTKYFADNKQYIGKTVYEIDKISGKRQETRYIDSEKVYFLELDYEKNMFTINQNQEKVLTK